MPTLTMGIYRRLVEVKELSKENFPDFKAKVRSSMITTSHVDIVKLTKGMDIPWELVRRSLTNLL